MGAEGVLCSALAVVGCELAIWVNLLLESLEERLPRVPRSLSTALTGADEYSALTGQAPPDRASSTGATRTPPPAPGPRGDRAGRQAGPDKHDGPGSLGKIGPVQGHQSG